MFLYLWNLIKIELQTDAMVHPHYAGEDNVDTEVMYVMAQTG